MIRKVKRDGAGHRNRCNWRSIFGVVGTVLAVYWERPVSAGGDYGVTSFEYTTIEIRELNSLYGNIRIPCDISRMIYWLFTS